MNPEQLNLWIDPESLFPRIIHFYSLLGQLTNGHLNVAYLSSPSPVFRIQSIYSQIRSIFLTSGADSPVQTMQISHVHQTEDRRNV